MRIFLIVSFLFVLNACSEEKTDENGAIVESCSSNNGATLSLIQVGDLKTDHPIFSTIQPSVFTSGAFCQENYIFNQYNSQTGGWCYYYDIDVECTSEEVTSIYVGQ